MICVAAMDCPVTFMIKKRRSYKSSGALQRVDDTIGRLKEMASRNKFKILFYPNIDWMHNILAKYGLAKNVIPSKVYPKLCTDPLYAVKDTHPSAYAHAEMAQEVYDYLRRNEHLEEQR